MKDRVNVALAARVTRAVHQAELSGFPDAAYLRSRYDAIFSALGAHQFLGVRVEQGGSGWIKGPDAQTGDPDAHSEWAWTFLPTLIDVRTGDDPFSGLLTAPPFITAMFEEYAGRITAVPEEWLDHIHTMIEACLVAIDPILYFRTVSADDIPRRSREASSEWDEFEKDDY